MKNPNIILCLLIIFLLFSCSNNPNKDTKITIGNDYDVLLEETTKLYEMEKWEEFVEKAETLIKESGKDYGLNIALSHAYSMFYNFDKAIEYAEMALKNDPNDYYALLLLGNYSSNIKEFEAAEYFYLSTLEINPNYARAYINLAMVYIQQNKNNLAIENLKKAISLFSKNGFKDEVIFLSNEILKLDPENQFANEKLNSNILIYR